MLNGDRALSSGGKDRLGFREVAKRIAISLVDRASEDGLVIGLEGAWGSGKSSLLSLIEDELLKLPQSEKRTVINFRPWLIGNRDALIANLFGELSSQIDEVARKAGDVTLITAKRAKEAGKALRRFVRALSKTGSAIEFVGDVSGLVPIKLVGNGVKAARDLASEDPVPPQLSDLKDKLAGSLRELGHRFIITIDDVDRLEPAEVIEILRLVRSVVDLPNVVYLLCYDSKILAHSIEKVAQIESGHSYLEKIVQLTVMVPRPEELQLRQWFLNELHLMASAKNEDELSRLKGVIDFEGGRRLQTPRSVVRALDAIRFFWPPLREAKGDLADLVWLQLIKDGNPRLYRWIERYCTIAAVISLGTARVEEAERSQVLAELLATETTSYFDDLGYRYNFAEQLPGVEVEHSKDENHFRIFERVRDLRENKAVQNRRLASPDHYRLYFALADPSHALTQENYASMWTAAENGVDQARAALLLFHNEKVGESLTKADIMLERIKSGAYEVLSPMQCENFLLAFSQMMDDAYRCHPFDLFWLDSLWDRAQRLIPLLCFRLEPVHRAIVVTKMFTEGVAIGWLTSVLRQEMFAHGRGGDRRRPEEEWIFSNTELDQITERMLYRYRAISARDVFRCPNSISLLFTWRQAGDEQGPRQLIEQTIASDEGLLETLEHLTSTIVSGDRARFNILTKGNLSPFMDYENAKQRTRTLTEHNDLGERARCLVIAFDDGDRH